MEEGVVLWFDKKKGYGFIKSNENKPDVFVHYTGLEEGTPKLNDGDEVVFERAAGEKGDKAQNVKKK